MCIMIYHKYKVTHGGINHFMLSWTLNMNFRGFPTSFFFFFSRNNNFFKIIRKINSRHFPSRIKNLCIFFCRRKHPWTELIFRGCNWLELTGVIINFVNKAVSKKSVEFTYPHTVSVFTIEFRTTCVKIW